MDIHSFEDTYRCLPDLGLIKKDFSNGYGDYLMANNNFCIDNMSTDTSFLDAINYCIWKDNATVLKTILQSNNCTVHLTDKSVIRQAIKQGSVDSVQILLENGCNAAIDESYLLCIACSESKYEIAKLLVKHGADVCADDNDPIRLAFTNNNYSLCKFLLEKGANAFDKRLDDIVNVSNSLSLASLLKKHRKGGENECQQND